MTAARRNIQITRGDDYSHAITFQDSGAPQDKAGFAYRAQIRRHANGDTATELDVDDSRLDEGIVVLTLDKTVTRALPAVGVWDFEQTAPGGIVTTLLAGVVVVRDDVTRDGEEIPDE